MKLLMISGDRSILQGRQGAFWYTLEEFRKHWERIDVVCPKSEAGGQKSEVPFDNVFFHPSPISLWRQSSWILRKGKELIAEHGHAVMTVHEYPPFYNGIGARWLTRMTGVPHVLEVHHVVGYPRAASITEWIGRMLSRGYLPGAIGRSAATRVVNDAAKELLVTWGAPAGKIGVVPSLYLDTQMLQPDPSAGKVYDVVFCGRLVENKGLLEFLEAVASLSQARALVIGAGPLRGRAEALVAAKGMNSRVTFAGWLPDQREVMRAIQSARVLVMNSKSEGGPRVVFEAMACGMPVIATPVGLVPEVIRDGENGLLTTGEPVDLRRKIETLLQDDGLRRHLAMEAPRVTERFERRKLIGEYAGFLKAYARSDR